jgi:hypothetical protein
MGTVLLDGADRQHRHDLKSRAVRSHHRCDPNDAWAAADRLLPHQGKSRIGNEAAGDRQYGLRKLMTRSDHASVASEAFFSADLIAF